MVAPEGSGKSKLKRTIVNIREYLKKKKSIISINNNDNFCLARALVVAVAKIQKDPKYDLIKRSNRPAQLERALDLHQAANVPLGPCGMEEVKLFQNILPTIRLSSFLETITTALYIHPNPQAPTRNNPSTYITITNISTLLPLYPVF